MLRSGRGFRGRQTPAATSNSLTKSYLIAMYASKSKELEGYKAWLCLLRVWYGIQYNISRYFQVF